MKLLCLTLLSVFGIVVLSAPVSGVTIAQQTQQYGDSLTVWDVMQELGDNLSGTAGKFTFRVSTAKPNLDQFFFTALNSRIYDKNDNSFIHGCITIGADPLNGLTFNTEGIPSGYQDVTIDFSCHNYQFIPGHKYLVRILSAYPPLTMLIGAVAYQAGGLDYFTPGGLRYGNGNTFDYANNSGSCNITSYIYGSQTYVPGSGCFIWTTPKDDIYFKLTNTTPEPTPTPSPVPSKTPLILIPGIGGSELKVLEDTIWSKDDGHGGTFNHIYFKDEKVWVNEGEAAKPGEDDYFDVLRMQNNGVNSEADLGLTGNLYAGAYGETINFFTSNGYTFNQDLFVFPYDWRLDLTGSSSLLDQKIQEIKNQTGAEKVDIISHSMGGLVARNYIADENRAQNVRKLFTLGTPHLGAVEQIKGIKYGTCLTDYRLENLPFCIGLSPSEIKDVIQNMIGGYELTPSQKYFDFYDGSSESYPFPFLDASDIDSNGVTGALDYNKIKDLLTNLGHNTTLFNPTETFHNLDNNLSNTNGVEVYIISGSGIPTLGQIIEKNIIDFLGLKIPKKDEVMINGDETVPLYSSSLNDPARNLSFSGNANIYYTKQKHGILVTDGPALNLVRNILDDDSQIPEGVTTTPFSLNGTQVSVHSPVEMHVFDQNGNHTGPTPDGEFEINIPGSLYNILDDAKFIWLPEDGIYRIEFEATGNGSFDFKIRKFENDINTETALYKDIPINETSAGEASLDTQSATPPTLNIDNNLINPTGVVNGNEHQDTTFPEIQVSFDLESKRLEITGTDESNLQNFNPEAGVKIFKDLADNSIQVKFNETNKKFIHTLSLNELKYNESQATLPSNKFIVIYTYNPKTGRVNVINQDIWLKGDKIIWTIYNPKTNKTKVFRKDKGSKLIKEDKLGMVLLKLITKNGQFLINY